MACCPSSVLRLIPPSTLSAARIRNPSFGMSRPKPAEISLSRSCNETSGISPSTYRTLRCRGADQRRRDSPAATANPMDRPNHDLPTPRGAYSIAKLRSGKIGESNISLAGISMFKKSFIPNARRDCLFGSETVLRIGIMLRPGMRARCKIFLKFCNMKMSGNIPTVGFGRIPSLHGLQLLFRLGLNPVDGLPLQTSGLRDC